MSTDVMTQRIAEASQRSGGNRDWLNHKFSFS
jgi:hypothetical protein